MADGKTRSEIFREQRPDLSDAEMLAAAQDNRIAASFMAQPVCLSDGTVGAIAIKWKLSNGSTETIIVDRYPATILRMLLERLDENNWTGTVLLPPDATPQ
jgi:hypothetical protein